MASDPTMPTLVTVIPTSHSMHCWVLHNTTVAKRNMLATI